jgi:hypothetical protein
LACRDGSGQALVRAASGAFTRGCHAAACRYG